MMIRAFIITIGLISIVQGQDTTIVLNQGSLVGLKVFPETSRTPVFVYLGVPYAKPPMKDLRFAPPVPHPGWNRTLSARTFKPICPQIDNNVYEEVEFGFNYNNKITSEDCLYLNIWAPETARRYGKFPVVLIITGEEFSFDWLINRPAGLDLASEGLIVVTVQYRTNIFGWFTLENEDSPGNLALLDQNLALVWLKENIHKFGGDSNKITLMGHGTTGAHNVMTHMTNSRTKNLFKSAILVSGTLYNKWYDFDVAKEPSPSEKVVTMLACGSTEKRHILSCMKEKSVSDLLRAFDNIYQNGNYSRIFGPIIDDFLPPSQVYVRDDPTAVFKSRNFDDIPILMGICSNEGAFMHEQWVDLARQGLKTLKKHVDTTILPNILQVMGLQGTGQNQIEEAINWKYFDQIPKTPPYMLNAIQRLLSEVKFEIPFYETLEIISKSWKNSSENVTTSTVTNEKTNFYVFLFQESNSMDMRGKINYFGGASHSSDLPFLLGPSLYQQIARKKMTSAEEKLCRKMRQVFAEFIKTGNPTPGRLYDAWHPFTFKQKYIRILDSTTDGLYRPSSPTNSADTELNLEKIEALLNPNQDEVQIVTSDVSYNPYSLNVDKEIDQIARQSKTIGFLETVKDSEFYYYLKKIYAFWDSFLPKLSKMLEQEREYIKEENSEQELLLENASPKYKHAFFSMLTLVCILLAILCVCVYILKKNDGALNNSVL